MTRRSLLASLMALSLLCGGLGVASAADSTVHVDASTTPGNATEVYTTTGVTTLLADYGKKEDVQNNKNNIANLQTTTIAQGQKITENTTNIANNKEAIDKKIDKETADATYATKEALNNLTTTVNGKADKTYVDQKFTEAGTSVETKLGDYYNKADVDGKITAEENARNTAINTAITQERNDRTTAIDTAINGEVAARTQAINTAITQEVTARDLAVANAKAELQGKITAEETARKEADTDFNTRLTTAEGKIGANETAIGDLKAADTALEGEITKNREDIATLNGKVATAEGNITDLKAKDTDLEKKIQTNADNIQTNSKAIADTNKRTAGIDRIDARHETKIEGHVTVDDHGNVTADGAVNAGSLTVTGASELKGDVTLGTSNGTNTVTVNGTANFNAAVNMDKGLNVTNGETNLGNTTVDGNLKVTGTITTDKMVFGETPNNYTEIDHGKVTSKNLVVNGAGETISSSSTFDVEKNEVGFGNGITDEQSSHKQTSDVITDTVKNNNTGDQSFHKQTSDVIMDNVKDGKNSNNRTQTKTETKDIITDENRNSSTTSQTASQNKTYLKDKDGKNTNSTIDTAKEYDKTIKGENGKTSTKQTATDITNTAEAGTIKNTAKNVTNEGTESVTNKVGANEVKVSTNSVDITAEAGKKITESVGTASRVVENDKITDNAGGSTVTTEKDKGTTFGKAGSTDTTNIYGDSIKTGTINAKDTTTDKLTAGAAAGADGGRLTVDAKDGVKGSYKSDKYTSKSYILANTLNSGVDNGKKPTDADFVGSRTDHYMVGDKAKLDETVKDADGSNVTNKTSTDTVTTITDGTTTTKTEQGVKDITNTATGGTITNTAKDIVNNAQDTITNQVKDSKVTTDANGTTFENNTPAVSDGGTTTTQINGNQITTGRVDANELSVSDKDGANTANLTVKAGEGVKASAGNGTTTGSLDVKGDKVESSVKDGDKTNTVTSTADGTTFNNSKANTAFEGGTYKNTTIKGNTITTGKVTMDYADVMKDLGVYGNATVAKDMTVKGNTTLGEAGKDTTLTVNSKATFNENAIFENGAEVKNGLTVSSGGLNVTGESTFNDKVTMNNGLDVTGGVASDSFTVKGTDIKIDSSGINAGGTVISNVADGSISEGSKDAVNGGQLYGVKRDLEHQVDKVGANAAAMANLRPMEFDPSSKWNIAAAIGNYGSETAAALGAFYRPNDDVMVNLSTAFGTGENMVGGGVSVRLGKGGNKLSREENNALKDQVNDLTARMDALLSVLNPNMSKDFPDVPENHWAYEAVSRLAGNDIVQGYPDGEFHGERTMTRYEMAEIIYNALSRGAEAEKELVEEFKPELQAMAASEKATAERAEG